MDKQISSTNNDHAFGNGSSTANIYDPVHVNNVTYGSITDNL